MNGKFEFRIQTVILLLMLPAIILVTCGSAWFIYSRLHADIISIFDRRLQAVSTVTAAFIEPNEHDRILRPKAIVAMSRSSGSRRLYALDEEGGLLEVQCESGESQDLNLQIPFRARDLAFDPVAQTLYLLGTNGLELQRLDLETGKLRLLVRLEEAVRGVAWDAESSALLLAGDALSKLKPTDPSPQPLEHSVSFTGPVALGSGRELVGLSSDGSRLQSLDLRTGKSRFIEPILKDPEGTCVDERFRALVADGGVAYLAGARLFQLDLSSGEVMFEGYPGFRSERAPGYRRYVQPMRRIRQKAGLTYLYTFVLRGDEKGEIVYVLDASQGEDHSRIGDIDADQADMGTREVLQKGGVHLSPIEYWEQWGMIKSADAAIYDREGKVRALAGADVNVSVIEKKTRSALSKIGLIGFFCIGLASIAAVKVSDRLVRPIEALKSEALKIAAGKFGDRVAVGNPFELSALSGSLNQMSGTLQQTLDELAASNRELELERRRHELSLLLTEVADAERPCGSAELACGRIAPCMGRYEASGWSVQDGGGIFWFADSLERDALEVARRRSDLAHLVRRLSPESADAVSFLRLISARNDVSFVLWNRREWTLACQGSGDVWFLHIDSTSREEGVIPKSPFKMPEQGVVFLSNAKVIQQLRSLLHWGEIARGRPAEILETCRNLLASTNAPVRADLFEAPLVVIRREPA